MVRSRAHLLETDDAATTRARIAEMLAAARPRRGGATADRAGAARAARAPATPRRAAPPELFSAWRTFFERLAGDRRRGRSLFEDLHWADPGTLDFIEHMLEWSRNVPILIITLARPELLDSGPAGAPASGPSSPSTSQPLDDASMRELLGGPRRSACPEPAVRSIVARAEGMPLYAVETIRMLVADGRLRELSRRHRVRAGRRARRARGPGHAACAHRRPPRRRSTRPTARLVQDAAVLGQSFTLDAARRRRRARTGPASTRGSTAWSAPSSSDSEVDPRSPERGQYAFVQALIREVAYSTLSLRDRRTRHLAAARYFESIGDDELAGALAAHYLAAYRASTEGPEAEALVAPGADRAAGGGRSCRSRSARPARPSRSSSTRSR